MSQLIILGFDKLLLMNEYLNCLENRLSLPQSQDVEFS